MVGHVEGYLQRTYYNFHDVYECRLIIISVKKYWGENVCYFITRKHMLIVHQSFWITDVYKNSRIFPAMLLLYSICLHLLYFLSSRGILPPKSLQLTEHLRERFFLRILKNQVYVTWNPRSPGLCFKLCCSSRSPNSWFTNSKKLINICWFEMNFIQSNACIFQCRKKENHMGLFNKI